MKRIDTPLIRNVALVGHGGTGKTSLGEAMLYTSQATTRLGSVNDRTSTFDFEPEEMERQTSYSSAVASIEWKKHKINIVDTPGDLVFGGDTRLCMAATDLTVILVSAIDNIEVGTDRTWSDAKALGRPRMVYVAKMDKERASFDTTLAAMQKEWGPSVAPLQIPIGASENFKGVVDLLDMKAYTYGADGKGVATVGDVPADLTDKAADAREALIEAIASADDDLLEKYLETMELSEEEVTHGLKSAIATGKLVPVVCGSATQNFGSDTFMDVIARVAPCPTDVEPPKATDGSGNDVQISCDANGDFAGLVFKCTYLEMGKVCFIRIFQGQGNPDLTFYNMDRETKERWGQVLVPFGKKLDAISSGVPCGDIIAVAKLKDTIAGNALCAERSKIAIETPPIPNPCISYAVRAKKKGEEDKMATAMARVLSCDPSLLSTRDEQTKDHLLSGMGQTHIEVAAEKIRRFGGDVELLPPRVPYRECIRAKKQRIEGKHKKQSGGRGQFGLCFLDMEPMPRGGGFEFVNAIFGGSIPSQFVPSVEKGVASAMANGPLAGYPVVDVKVTCVDGKHHPVDSDGRSFEIAGRKGFKEGVMQCSPTLLEPYMAVEITVPDDCMGDVMGDINSRRGRIQGMDAKGGRQIIRAQAPMAELLSYAPDLRSITAGRGFFTQEFSHYEEVPGQLVDKIVADNKSDSDDE